MTFLEKPSLVLVLLATLVVAGCTDAGSPDRGDSTPPPAMTHAEARTALTDAVSAMPEAFGVDMKIISGGKEALTFKGSFDNASGTSYVEIRGDPAALSNLTPGEGAGVFLANGFSLYTTPEGSMYLANGTAFVFPPRNDTDDGSGRVPTSAAPEDGPLAAFLDPEEALSSFTGSGVNVTSVVPLVYRGKPAVEITLTHPQDGETVTSEVTVFTQPRRLARVETTLPAQGSQAGDPLAGGRLEGDFYYDGEVTVRAPASATRALGLAYESDRSALFGGDARNFTWTFLRSEGIALGEVEAQVKTQDGQTTGDLSTLPTAFALRLSDGTVARDGVTLTFTDADGDGKVSQGDTLRAEIEEGGEFPTVVLYDTVTETYVVPGPGLVATLALAALAGLLLRRRV